MESRAKKSRTPKKSAAKAKSKKKTTEKESEFQESLGKIIKLQSCLEDPYVASVVAEELREEDEKEIGLRSSLLDSLLKSYFSTDDEIKSYTLFDEQDEVVIEDEEMKFNRIQVPEEYKKYIEISDKKMYLNDHPTNRYQSVDNLLRHFIALFLHKLEYTTIQEQALDILTDVIKAYIERIGFLANSFESVPGHVMTPLEIMEKTFEEIYPKGIREIMEFFDKFEQNKMVMEEVSQIKADPSATLLSVEDGTDVEKEEQDLDLLKRELFLMRSPFVKRKEQSYAALYKDAFRANVSSQGTAQSRTPQFNKQGSKVYESPNYGKYSTPTTEKRKRTSDYSYSEETYTVPRSRRSRSKINYEEFDDDDYGDDLDDEIPKKKRRKSTKR